MTVDDFKGTITKDGSSILPTSKGNHGFRRKKRLQNIYDAEVTQRLLNPSESKVYSELTRQKHPDISLNTFGCVELLLPFIKLGIQESKTH